MQVELQHSFTVPTSVDDAWALFMDLERVGNCFPGATVTEATDSAFSGTVKVKLGPITLLYAGSGSFVERDEAAYRAVLQAKGKDKRGNGTAGATVTIELSPDGEGTRADVTTDMAITGKPAQFGRGVMQDVSDKLLGQFSACIEQQLTEPTPEAVAAELTSKATEASQALAPATTLASAADTPAHGTLRRVAAPEAATDDALDLGSAVLPVLARRYAGFALTAIGGVIVGWLLGSRRSRG